MTKLFILVICLILFSSATQLKKKSQAKSVPLCPAGSPAVNLRNKATSNYLNLNVVRWSNSGSAQTAKLFLSKSQTSPFCVLNNQIQQTENFLYITNKKCANSAVPCTEVYNWNSYATIGYFYGTDLPWQVQSQTTDGVLYYKFLTNTVQTGSYPPTQQAVLIDNNGDPILATYGGLDLDNQWWRADAH